MRKKVRQCPLARPLLPEMIINHDDACFLPLVSHKHSSSTSSSLAQTSSELLVLLTDHGDLINASIGAHPWHLATFEGELGADSLCLAVLPTGETIS